jgi:hypothetical protein
MTVVHKPETDTLVCANPKPSSTGDDLSAGDSDRRSGALVRAPKKLLSNPIDDSAFEASRNAGVSDAQMSLARSHGRAVPIMPFALLRPAFLSTLLVEQPWRSLTHGIHIDVA